MSLPGVDVHTDDSLSREKRQLNPEVSSVSSRAVAGTSRIADENRHYGDVLKGREDEGEACRMEQVELNRESRLHTKRWFFYLMGSHPTLRQNL